MFRVLYILGLVLCSFSDSLRAEAYLMPNQKKISFPLYMGFGFNRHQGTLADALDTSVGPAFGFGFEYRPLPKVKVGFDALYIKKGYEIKSANIVKFDLSYLELPVQVKYSPIPQITLHGGPYLASIILSGTKEVQGTEGKVRHDFNHDFGITTGVWVGFHTNPVLSIGLDLRADIGLADIQNDLSPADTVRSRTFYGMLTFLFSVF